MTGACLRNVVNGYYYCIVLSTIISTTLHVFQQVQLPTDDLDKEATPKEEEGGFSDDEEHYSSCSEDNSEGSEFSEEEVEDHNNRVKQAKRIPGAIQVLPPLSDQFKLLSPKSQQISMSYDDSNSSVADTTAPSSVADTKVQKKKPKASSVSTSEDLDESADVSPPIPRRRGSTASASSDVDGETEKKSWMIQSTKPPWLEMVEVMRGCVRDGRGEGL